MNKFIKTSILALTILAVACSKKPEACFTTDKAAVEKTEEITFNNCSSDASSVEWDFGDGNKSTEAAPKHSYTVNGDYTVTLTTKSGSKTAKTTHTVTVGYPALGAMTIQTTTKLLGGKPIKNIVSVMIRNKAGTLGWDKDLPMTGNNPYSTDAIDAYMGYEDNKDWIIWLKFTATDATEDWIKFDFTLPEKTEKYTLSNDKVSVEIERDIVK